MPGNAFIASREKPVSRPPGGRQAGRGEQHAGQPHVAGEAQAAVALGRDVEARQRLAESAAPCRAGGAAASPAGCGSAASSASSAKVKVRTPLMTKPSAVSHSVGDDVPAVGGGADQHRPRHRRGIAQRLLERAHRGRAGGDPHALPASPDPRRAGWHKQR